MKVARSEILNPATNEGKVVTKQSREDPLVLGAVKHFGLDVMDLSFGGTGVVLGWSGMGLGWVVGGSGMRLGWVWGGSGKGVGLVWKGPEMECGPGHGLVVILSPPRLKKKKKNAKPKPKPKPDPNEEEEGC